MIATMKRAAAWMGLCALLCALLLPLLVAFLALFVSAALVVLGVVVFYKMGRCGNGKSKSKK